MSERYGKGSVERVGGLWVLHLKGTSFERGLQHGTLMRYRVRDAINFYRGLPDLLVPRLMPEASVKMKVLKKLKKVMMRRFLKISGADALEEIRGLAVGLGLKTDDLVEALIAADVVQVAGAVSERNSRSGPPVLPGMCCTSAIRETSSGGFLFGRNFDFWGAGYWDANPAVLFHHPDKGKAFCSIATAGFPTAGITSINEDGLAVAIHQHGSLDSSPKGVPIIDIVHNIARNASNVEEAVDIVGGTRSTGGWSIVMAGGSPPGAAVLEVSPVLQKERRLEDGSLAASDFFVDEELSSREFHSSVSGMISARLRFKRAADLVASPRVGPSRMAGILGDHYDILAERERSAGFSISSIATLSSVIFSLPEKRFWVSESAAPASRGGYVGFDLEAELEGKRSTVERIEGGRPPGVKITSAQEKYLEASKEYISSGDLNRVLLMLGECSSIDPAESTFPLMVGNHRGALSAVRRSLELEKVSPKKTVALLWNARILDLLDHRDRSRKIYEELAENPENPLMIVDAASRGLRKPFSEKDLGNLIVDFTTGDTLE
jgi:hypothetical protein